MNETPLSVGDLLAALDEQADRRAETRRQLSKALAPPANAEAIADRLARRLQTAVARRSRPPGRQTPEAPTEKEVAPERGPLGVTVRPEDPDPPQRASPALAVCPSCGKGVRPGARFCIHCGSALEPPPATLCPGCQAPVHPGARFCRECGEPLADESRSAAGG